MIRLFLFALRLRFSNTSLPFFLPTQFSTICVPRQDYKAINGHLIKDLQPGTYSFRIIAQSDGSKGNWTEMQTFVVPEKSKLVFHLFPFS